jgi:ribosomal protein S18 acetylase RimI-like enzyme
MIITYFALLIILFFSILIRRRNQHKRDVAVLIKEQEEYGTKRSSKALPPFRIRNGNKDDIGFISQMHGYAMQGWIYNEFGAHHYERIVSEAVRLIVEEEDCLYSYKNTYILELKQNDEWVCAGSFCGYPYSMKKAKEEISEAAWSQYEKKAKSMSFIDGLIGSYELYLQNRSGSKYPFIFSDGDYYLSFMGIAKEFRGYGLSKLLLDQLEKVARSYLCNAIRLDTAQYNRRAIQLYEKHGYRFITSHGVPGPTLAIHMMKELK